MKAPTLWAIQWGPHSNRARGWIDYTTISTLRRDAWAEFEKNTNHRNVSEKWLKEVKRRRRKGLIRAVRVTLTVAE